MKSLKRLCLTLVVCLFWQALPATAGDITQGRASYYADSLQGNKTASGEAYDKNAMTAAHRTLDFGTVLRVTYPKAGKTVKVRVNDRGPHVKDRLIDVSGAAAAALGLKEDGVGEVEIEVVRQD
jgi:rare lipoprotein A